MKAQRIIYWIATILFCAIIGYSIFMYFTKTPMVQELFEGYGYPAYLVIPLAFAKLFGILMILWRYSKWLTYWAYAGFFFDILLASGAHYHAGEPMTFTLLAIVLLLISFFFGSVVRY